MLPFGTKGADVARRLMHQAVTYHFILPFEAFTAFGPRTRLYRTVMRSVLTVHVCMGTMTREQVLLDEEEHVGAATTYFKRYCVWKGAAVQPEKSHLKFPVARGPVPGRGGNTRRFSSMLE